MADMPPLKDRTVFFVIAAWCFSRSSPRLERWVLNLPHIGPLVHDYRAGLGIEAALKEIEAKRGIWFEPAAVDACLRLFREKRFSL